MCLCFCIEFIDFMLDGEIAIDFTSPYIIKKIKENDEKIKVITFLIYRHRV